MTPKAQRIAIAEACGWNSIGMFNGNPKQPSGFPPGIDKGPESLPDYTTDLNAMHDAEKVLTEKQQVWYLQKLTQVRFKQGVGGMIGCMIDKTTFATAAQRAEAFLRCLNLWTEQ